MNESVKHSTEFGDIAIRAWQIYKSNWKWIGLVALVALVLGLISTFLANSTTSYVWSAWDDFETVGNTTYLGNQTANILNGAINLAGVALLVAIISLIAMVTLGLMSLVIFNATYNGQKVSWREALRLSSNRFLPALGTVLFMLAVVVPSSFLLVGIYLAVLWTFVAQVALFENKGGMAALHSSEIMVRGRWWKTFTYMIVVAIIVWIVGGIPQLLFGQGVQEMLVSNLLTGAVLPPTYYVYTLVQSVLSVVLIQFMMAFSLVMYYGWKNTRVVQTVEQTT